MLFAAFFQGVYRHECIGIFSTVERAEEGARAALGRLPDDYHSAEIVEFELDVPTPSKKDIGWGTRTVEPAPILRLLRECGVITAHAREQAE